MARHSKEEAGDDQAEHVAGAHGLPTGAPAAAPGWTCVHLQHDQRSEVVGEQSGDLLALGIFPLVSAMNGVLIHHNQTTGTAPVQTASGGAAAGERRGLLRA